MQFNLQKSPPLFLCDSESFSTTPGRISSIGPSRSGFKQRNKEDPFQSQAAIMAVVDNAGVDQSTTVGSSSLADFEAAAPDSRSSNGPDHPKPSHVAFHQNPIMHDQSFHMKVQQLQQRIAPPAHVSGPPQAGTIVPSSGSEGFKREMRDLEELLSKLNPMAQEFVPPSLANHRFADGAYSNGIAVRGSSGNDVVAGNGGRRKKNNYIQGKRRMNSRTSMAQREEIIRRTVYVSDIDQQSGEFGGIGYPFPSAVHSVQVTEEQLAALFVNCGQVVDCRVCGDPNSVLRFAFIEFTDEEGARAALSLAGTMLGYYPVRVLPSKTAIAPVNPTFLPRSEDEREMCARTIYCTNIDKKVTQVELKLFFEYACGEVYRLRLLGDYHHSTRIAFVEFVMADSAIAALNCSGVVLGSLAIRVSPSKTPVRPRVPRPPPMP